MPENQLFAKFQSVTKKSLLVGFALFVGIQLQANKVESAEHAIQAHEVNAVADEQHANVHQEDHGAVTTGHEDAHAEGNHANTHANSETHEKEGFDAGKIIF